MRRVGLLVAAVLSLGVPATAPATYDPSVKVELPTAGGPGSPAAVSATITQATGEDSHRTIEARLPGTFGFNAGFALQGCTPADERAQRCPESSRIGRLSADSVFGPASGTLHLTEDFRLVAVIEGLGGLARISFAGIIEVLPGQEIVLRFDGLPDVSATRMTMAMDGGTRTPLALPRSCGTHMIRVRLVGRSGDERRSEHAVDVGGCRAALPKVTEPRVTRDRVLRWKLPSGAARTDVTLRRLAGGRWRELGTRSTRATTLRIGSRWGNHRLRRGRYALALVAIGADGTRSLTQVVALHVR